MKRRTVASKEATERASTEGSVIDFVFALPCDDVRTEITGKEILIGVYSGNIVASSFPANMLLCVWVQYVPKRTGNVEIELRLIGPNNAQLAHMAAGLTIDKVQYGTLHTPQLPIQVQTPGNLSIQIRVKDREWQTLRVVPIELLQAGTLGLPAGASNGGEGGGGG